MKAPLGEAQYVAATFPVTATSIRLTQSCADG